MSLFKKNSVILAITAGLLSIFWTGIAISQDDAQSIVTRIKPMLVQIEQSVPISVTVYVPVSETETMTLTVPATVDLDVNVSIADTVETDVQVVNVTNPALVTVSELLQAGGNLVNNNDIPYTVETVEGVELIQWITSENSLGWTAITGEVRNIDESHNVDSVKFTVTFYDEDGNLLDVETGYSQLDTIVPGQTSPFELSSSTLELNQIGRYLIQVEVRFER